MSEMIERVARVIGASYDGEADPVLTPNNWARAVEAARAAIDAMREPSKEMLLAAETPITYNSRYQGISPSPHVAWRRMIDSALGGKP